MLVGLFLSVFVSIFPFSLSLKAQYAVVLDSNLYSSKASFKLAISHPLIKAYNSRKQDTATIIVPFNTVYFPLYSDSLSKDSTNYAFLRYQDLAQPQFSRIKQSGSISRGIIVGSAQDASVESGMDLRFEAFLGDSIKVSASLTDQNTPIQPDGSSLQLREFDRILIQLQSNQTNASLGDIDLKLDKHPYLQLNRRVMGAEATWNSSTRLSNSGRSTKVQGGLAALRGQYQVALIPTIEGFQGPYRLTNEQGEPFVIVLAGSETIYLNGKKLERGSDRDYTIDYSFGEINFTSNRIIRASDRVRVEYQFLNQNYAQVLVAASYKQQVSNKWTFSYQLARTQAVVGAANTGLLTDEERNLLINAGDDVGNLRTERVQLADEGRTNPIRYNRIDTLLNGMSTFYYVFDPNGQFNVFFSRVSFGQGAYIRAVNQPINGIVYEFVGEGNGDFTPFRQIEAPTSKTVQSIFMEWNALKTLRINTSLAMSSFDQNRLSNKDDSDNHSFALFQDLTWKYSKLASIESFFQQSSSDFQSFDRIRDPEFERNWGGLTDNSFGERLFALKWRQKTNNGSSIVANYAQLRIAEEKKNRWELEAEWSEKWMNGQTSLRYLNQKNLGLNQDWLFINTDLSIGNLSINRWELQPLFMLSHENRSTNFRNNLTLNAINGNLSGPNYFLEYGSGLQVKSEKTEWKITLSKRNENVLIDSNSNATKRTAFLYTISQKSNQKYLKSQQRFSWFDIPNEPSFSIYSQQLGILPKNKGSIRLAYEGESRLQGVMTEIYTFVGNQFGVYYWDDINEDGIEQLDEYFPERSPEEGTHILQILPSEELQAITKVQASLQTSFSLNSLLNNADSDKGFGIDGSWSQMDENTTIDIVQFLRLNQALMLNDSLTLSGRQSSNIQLYWKGKKSITELRLISSRTQSLRNRNSFNERSNNEVVKLEAQIRPTNKIRIKNEVGFEKRRNETATLLNRRLDLSIYTFNSELNQAVSSRFKRSLFLEYKTGSGGFDTKFWTISVKSGINSIIKGGPLNIDLGINHTNLNGEFSPLANFELTGGQGVGTQLRADFRYSRSLGKGLKADVNWSLRTRANEQILQTARFTLNSSF